MQAASRSATFASIVASIFGSSLLVSQALCAAELDGAWTNDKAVCDKIFVENGGKIVFSDKAEFYGSGFVIDGRTIRGKAATCKIKSMSKRGNRIHIAATCATDVMLSDSQFDLTVGADGKLTRSFPRMPEMTMEYQRCTFPR